jgi:cytochrome oxidase Cu insertion factor (SCO1/SenC/PrrC family)
MMSKPQKVLTVALWCMAVLMMIVLVASGAWREKSHPLPVLYPAPEFSLTDQHGETFGSEKLAGKVYVINFIFTRCAGPCPLMTKKMAALHEQVKDAGVQYVSVSVDPDYDTPERLMAYGDRFKADHNRWTFLTGERKAVFDLAAGFKLAAISSDEPTGILHDERMLLIDQQGNVRGIYSSTHEEELAALAHDIRTLLASKGSGS